MATDHRPDDGLQPRTWAIGAILATFLFSSSAVVAHVGDASAAVFWAGGWIVFLSLVGADHRR